MLKIKSLLKPYGEMMVFREDIITLFQYLSIPGNDHAYEHPRLVECVSRLAKDFDIDVDDYVHDNGLVSEVESLNNWNACVERAWNE